MKLVIQRVSEASVTIDNSLVRSINKGLVVLIGIHKDDSMDDLNWIERKLLHMRIFSDDQGLMNKSVLDVNGDLLLVSQFTLYASTKKGNRPSYMNAAKPDHAIPLYKEFVRRMKNLDTIHVQTGAFGADMHLLIKNDGPVTIVIDSRDRI